MDLHTLQINALRNACRMLAERARADGRPPRFNDSAKRLFGIDDAGRPSGDPEWTAPDETTEYIVDRRHVLVLDAGRVEGRGGRVAHAVSSRDGYYRIGLCTAAHGKMGGCDEVHHIKRLQFVLVDSAYYTPHRRLSPLEAQIVRERYSSNLPSILQSDAVVKYFNFARGDVIEVQVPRTEVSAFAGEVKYRVVKAG